MEGYGYWIFLLILYGLSAFMKKRRQTVARRNLDQEEGSEPKSQFASKEEIFKELFGGKWMEENKAEPIPAHQQETEYLDSEPHYYEETEPVAPESTQTHDRFDTHISGIPEREEAFNYKSDHSSSMESTIDSEFDTLADQRKDERLSGKVTQATERKHANTHLIKMLKHKNALKYSFMLREVLDKPRAFRKNIR